jgi:hypothetical protein
MARQAVSQIEAISPVSPSRRIAPAGMDLAVALPERAGAEAKNARSDRPTVSGSEKNWAGGSRLGDSVAGTYSQFVFDEKNRQITQIKIVDSATGRVIREIPDKVIAELSAALRAYQAACTKRSGGETLSNHVGDLVGHGQLGRPDNGE